MGVHVTLSDGRTMELHLSTVGDQIDIVDFDYKKVGRLDRLKFYLDLLGKRLIEKSWDGDLRDLTPQQLVTVFQQWLRAVEDDAVPPASGSSSATPRREQRSRPRTASARRSSGRASSKS